MIHRLIHLLLDKRADVLGPFDAGLAALKNHLSDTDGDIDRYLPDIPDGGIDQAIGEVIREQLNRHSADLLVLGAYGDRKPSVGMGTLASACVRSLPTDVLLVRDNYRDPFRTVVAGIDFSHTSRLARWNGRR